MRRDENLRGIGAIFAFAGICMAGVWQLAIALFVVAIGFVVASLFVRPVPKRFRAEYHEDPYRQRKLGDTSSVVLGYGDAPFGIGLNAERGMVDVSFSYLSGGEEESYGVVLGRGLVRMFLGEHSKRIWQIQVRGADTLAEAMPKIQDALRSLAESEDVLGAILNYDAVKDTLTASALLKEETR